MILTSKWHADRNNDTIVFKGVRFDHAARGLKVIYKSFSGGTFDLTLSVDGTPVSKFVLNGTAYYHELEDAWAEVPEILPGTHDIAVTSEPIGNAYIESFEFTPDSPYDVVPETPVRTFRETEYLKELVGTLIHLTLYLSVRRKA